MKKIIVMPDSFKGTLSSKQICETIKTSALQHFPDCEVVTIPVADGGEGSVDCIVSALDGKIVSVKCNNPYFEDMDSFYGLVDGEQTAIIEMASCAGLPLVENRKNPMLTTTYGVGEQIASAIARGCGKIILGLGGSSTNDGGCGAAAAVGVRFYNATGELFVPTGETLLNISRIDMSERINIDSIEIVAMCDIDNILYGPTGAAYVFAPQKGADRDMVAALDEGLVHLSRIIKRDLGIDVSSVAGGGAAGGFGAGALAFLGAKLQRGIDAVLDTVKFEKIAADADIVFTGEGKMDSQSIGGKVISGIARRAKLINVPVVAIVGGADEGIDHIYDMGVNAIFTTNRLPEDFSVSRHKSGENLKFAIDNIMKLLKI